MITENISDSRTHSHYRKFLKTQNGNTKEKLKGIFHCGSKILKPLGAEPAVFILKNNNEEAKDQTKMFGVVHCNSAWACPKCTARIMAKKGGDIACLIDALARKENRYAFMITFTFPHTKYMSCSESFQILLKAWRRFSRKYRPPKRKYTIKSNSVRGKKGEKRFYQIKETHYTSFREDLDIKHYVKVYEFTWSDINGWHPHIHALFWTKKENFEKIKSYIDKLNAQWWHCIKLTAEEIIGKEFLESIYPDWKRDYHKSVTLSVDEKNNPRIEESSYYISGWSGNAELTGIKNKKARNGHYSSHQILELAMNAKTTEEKNKWFKLFTEYALATKNHRRVEFSKIKGVSCKKIIENWKKTNEYIETFKKKAMDKDKDIWSVAYWFNEKQWSQIYRLDCLTNEHVILNIKIKAKNIKELEEYLQKLGVPLTRRRHKLMNYLESFKLTELISA